MSVLLPSGMPGPGEFIAGKYRITRVLGIGGMGVVFAAQHQMLGEEVALKLMLAEAMQGDGAVVRFVNEARSAAKVKGEHVVRVLDVAVLDDGRPYIVMELLEGVDLGQLLEKTGPLGAEDTVDYLLQGMEAIAQAHAKGVVHRDLKPSNLFLATQPDGGQIIKVLDFGIAKATAAGAHPLALTKTKAMMGSPIYMSPEQIRNSKDAGAQSDIWALGITAFELLTGRTPFEGETVGELLLAVVEQAPPEVHALRPGIAPALGGVIACCLEKDRAKRYKTVVELARALRPFASPAGAGGVERVAAAFSRAGTGSVSAPDVAARASIAAAALEPTTALLAPVVEGSGPSAPAAAARTNAAWTGSRPQSASTRRRWLLPVVAACVLLSGGLLVFALRAPPPPPMGADTPAVEPSVSAPASPVTPPPLAPLANEPAPAKGAAVPSSTGSAPAAAATASARAPRPQRRPTTPPTPISTAPPTLKPDRNSF